MSTYKNICPFCNKNDSPPSREHILASWIGVDLNIQQWEVTNLNTQQTYRTRKNLGLVTQRPCRRCNNEWMNDLEKLARPVLNRLMNGEQTTLTHRDQLVIIFWLLKTSMTFDLLGEKKRPCYFEPTERHALYRFLEASPIPPSTQVFLARYKGSLDSGIRETHVELARWTGDPNPDALSRLRGYSVTLAIKELVLQIFCARGLPDGVAYYALDFTDAFVQIGLGGDVSWPPPKRFDDEGLGVFTERWLHLKPPP